MTPNYIVAGPAGPADSTLVFLHGLGGDHTNWQPQFDQFAATHRCIAWTLPGYGTSPAIDSMTWPKLSELLVGVFDEIGVERASVIGLSMGGFVAQQFAADHPDRVDQLVLAGTTAQFGRGSKSFAEQFLAARLKPIDGGAVPADFATAVVTSLLSDDASTETVANAVASMSQISAEAYRQALTCLVTWDFVDRLDDINAPTLCVAADNDKTAPVAALQALADGITEAQLVVIENCNHLMNLDRPAAFNTLIRDLLNQS